METAGASRVAVREDQQMFFVNDKIKRLIDENISMPR
jgi:hypothetical protein